MILSKSFDKNYVIKTTKQLYYDTTKLLRTILSNKEIYLITIKDIDFRPGEFETILQKKFNYKSSGGKIL